MEISIGALIAATKTSIEVVKQGAEAITAVRAAAKVDAPKPLSESDDRKLADLADKLVEARVRTLDMLDVAEKLHLENTELRAAIAKKERFGQLAQKYQMRRYPDAGVFYEYVPDGSDNVPVHAVCPNCYESERISHLQVGQIRDGSTYMTCPACATKVLIPNDRKSDVATLVPIRRSSFWEGY